MNGTHLSRRRLLGLGGALGATIALPNLLTACGGSSSASAGSGKLTFWSDITGAPNQQYFTDKVLGAFHKAHPDISVKTTFYKGSDLQQQIRTALQARTGPDIVRAPSVSQTIPFANAHLLADLTPYSKKWGWDKVVSQWAREAFTIDGKLYALPMRVDTMMVYTNKTLFDSKGWTTPQNRSDLESWAAEAAGHGITPFGSSSVDWAAAGEWLMTLFWNNFSGPDAVYQALTGQIQFTDPTFVDAVTLLKSYFDKGWIAGGPSKYFSVPSAEIGASLGKGTTATIIQGEWYMSNIGQFFGSAAGNDSDWDWFVMPPLSSDVKAGSMPVGFGGSYAVNSASKQQDDAAQFLNWFYSDKSAALQRMADVPATYDIAIDFTPSEIPSNADPRTTRLLTSVNQAISSGNYGYVTWTWWPPKTDTMVFQNLEQVLTGKTTPAEYCQQIADSFTAEFKAGAAPKLMKRA
jgi:raffinose/stachyose/melibiose transport system substrate-binding protein